MSRNTWVQLYNDDPRGLSADGLTVANTTTSGALFQGVVFPANYFKTGRLLHLRCRGIYATTATPTLTFRLQESAGTVVTIVTSAAVTGGNAQSNMPFEADIQIQCRSEGTSGTLQAMGDMNFGLTSTTQTNFYLPAAGTAPANATVDTTIQQTWQFELAWSAAAAQNTATGKILEIKSIN